MMHSYAFSNFRCFLDRVEVPFTLTERDPVNGWARISSISEQRLTTAMAVLGPNASGKTTMLQPLAFLGWFVRNSFNIPPNQSLPLIPHFNAGGSPTDFEVVLDATEPHTVWRYRLSTSDKFVLSESVESKTRRGQWKSIFCRTRTEEGKYEVSQNNFGLDQAQAENVRPNVSLISWATQFGVPLAQEMANVVVDSNLAVHGRYVRSHERALQDSVRYFATNEKLQSTMKSLLAQWDLGLSDILFEPFEAPDRAGEKEKRWFAIGMHRDAQQRNHSLPFAYESSGTQSAFMLLARLLPVLQDGGLVAYDELDGDLHPHMIEPLLDLFSNKETNPNDAQIIFTCHSPGVLRLLQKCQVMLVERDGLEAHAWRLDSMEGVRPDDNRIAKYLAGAYGAVPRL